MCPNNRIVSLESPPHPAPPVPEEIYFTVHWLAVRGVQPQIPQNPPQPGKPRHILSDEMHILYTHIVNALMDYSDDDSWGWAVKCVAENVGIIDLAPYLVRCIVFLMRNEKHRLRLLQLSRALLSSKSFNLAPYLRWLVPSILVCVTAPNGPHGVCEEACRQIGLLYTQYGMLYPNMKERILRSLSLHDGYGVQRCAELLH